MIGNKKIPMGMDTPNTDAVNRIVEGTTFEGNIRSMSNMRVDGTFQGDIVTKGRLVVGPKGTIKGNVSCANCDVEGSMEGTIEVAELMSMKRSAKVAGTIFYGQLSVEAGAQPVGTFHMGAKEAKKTRKLTFYRAFTHFSRSHFFDFPWFFLSLRSKIASDRCLPP